MLFTRRRQSGVSFPRQFLPLAFGNRQELRVPVVQPRHRAAATAAVVPRAAQIQAHGRWRNGPGNARTSGAKRPPWRALRSAGRLRRRPRRNRLLATPGAARKRMEWLTRMGCRKTGVFIVGVGFVKPWALACEKHRRRMLRRLSDASCFSQVAGESLERAAAAGHSPGEAASGTRRCVPAPALNRPAPPGGNRRDHRADSSTSCCALRARRRAIRPPSGRANSRAPQQ